MSALKKKRKDKGVTLIEVLVSGVLVSLSAIGILGVFTSGYMMINKAKIVHRATELAREKMEELNNQAIEDIYPTVAVGGAGEDEFDGYAGDTYLTSQKVVGQFVPGSDYVTFCPICGYANRGYVYVDWDDTVACTASGLYIDSAYPADNNGPGGVPDGYVQRQLTMSPPCVYEVTPVRCQNQDLNGDGVETDPHTSPVAVPRIGQAGFFYRYVKVRPKQADAAYSDYTYSTADISLMWQAAGYSILPQDLRRGQSRTVPLKEVESIVEWRAHGEKQSYSVKTILSRLVPKYGY